MKQLLTILIAIIICLTTSAQMTESEVLDHRSDHLKELVDPEQGMLSEEEITSFGGLDYFEFDSTYQITAIFQKSKGKKFEMPTSTERLPVYRRFGYITFTINGKNCKLEVYQNMSLKKKKEFKDYLFIPFRDATSRIEAYGGGRYLDVKIPKGNSIQLDFNLAYNPYCAYSNHYSCPIPPIENTLKVSILAGEKTPLAH